MSYYVIVRDGRREHDDETGGGFWLKQLWHYLLKCSLNACLKNEEPGWVKALWPFCHA